MMLLKLGRALGVALSCMFFTSTPALWAVSMPTSPIMLMVSCMASMPTIAGVPLRKRRMPGAGT